MRFWQRAQRKLTSRISWEHTNIVSYCAVLVVFFGNVNINSSPGVVINGS